MGEEKGYSTTGAFYIENGHIFDVQNEQLASTFVLCSLYEGGFASLRVERLGHIHRAALTGLDAAPGELIAVQP